MGGRELSQARPLPELSRNQPGDESASAPEVNKMEKNPESKLPKLVLYHHDGAVVEVRLEGRPLKMSPLERSLMALLATSPGEPVLHHFLVSELEVSDKQF